MKRFLPLVLLSLFLAAGAASGQPMMGGSFGPMMGGASGARPAHFKLLGNYGEVERAALREELGPRKLGELGGAELFSWADRLSVAAQKDAWLAASLTASLASPGKGQLMNGDRAGGGLFAAAHVGVNVGTLLAWYFLLPADLRFDGLDYLGTPLADIGARWNGKSLRDYLPSIGAMAGGMLLDGALRLWSGHAALLAASERVDSGAKSFQPLAGPGYLGMMFRY